MFGDLKGEGEGSPYMAWILGLEKVLFSGFECGDVIIMIGQHGRSVREATYICGAMAIPISYFSFIIT